jgi:hypothetical protein
LDYEDLTRELENIPVTWYPAIIKMVILESFKKKVWLGTTGFLHFVHKIMKEELS